jgi:hypothetical protein
MNGKRRRFQCWRMSLSANRIPLRRDMRWRSSFAARCDARRDEKAGDGVLWTARFHYRGGFRAVDAMAIPAQLDLGARLGQQDRNFLRNCSRPIPAGDIRIRLGADRFRLRRRGGDRRGPHIFCRYVDHREPVGFRQGVQQTIGPGLGRVIRGFDRLRARCRYNLRGERSTECREAQTCEPSCSDHVSNPRSERLALRGS